MPSFEDMQKLYMNVGTHGQQLKTMADMVMQQAFDTDIGTKQCYIYDYYHDDQFDEGLYGYNPALSKTKVKVDLRFIVKAYKSAAKDDPEYHIMFKPDFWNNLDLKTDEKLQWFNQYSDLGIRFPVGLYVDIPNDKGVYQKWLIFYDEDANQFPKFGVMKCNYLFTWIKDDGIHRYKRKMWGVERTQNSYTSCGIGIYNTARCIWKHCSVFLRICWNVLRAIIPKQKDEIYLDGKVKIIMDWIISREFLNREALNDYQLKYC